MIVVLQGSEPARCLMEGIDIGMILLLYVSLIALGLGSLAAAGLWIGRVSRGHCKTCFWVRK
jgi:hypothetical protein